MLSRSHLEKLEKEGRGVWGEASLESRITRLSNNIGTESNSSELSQDQSMESMASVMHNNELIAMAKVCDDESLPSESASATPQADSDGSSKSDLRSLLLYPRRLSLRLSSSPRSSP